MTLRNPRRTLVTRGLRTIVMLGTALPSAALAQSDVAFPEGVYVERRACLAARVEGAIVVIAGRNLINPGDALVKQDPNFWCLTGVESPYAVLVIALASGGVTRWTLFMSEQLQFAGGQFPMDEPAFRRAPWNRPRRRLAPGPGAV